MTKYAWLAALVAAGALTFGGCKSAENKATDNKPKADLVFEGSTTVFPIIQAMEKPFADKYKLQIMANSGGSGVGASALAEKRCNIAMLSREMKAEEIAAAKKNEVEPVSHEIALDALSVIVHPSNKVANLTKAQLKDIFSGKITNWKAVGGSDQEIVVVVRDSTSGTAESFKEFILGKTGPEVVKSAQVQKESSDMRTKVAQTEGAIGYVGLGFLNDEIKAIKVQGIEASKETVLDNTYPLSRKLYLYTDGQPAADSAVAKFLDFAKSDDGRAIIDSTGFVPPKKG